MLLLLSLMLFVSCPASIPPLPSSSDKPYLDPPQVQNLQVQSGLENRFVLTWDEVEEADWYVVEYASADQPSAFGRAAPPVASTSCVITGPDGAGGLNINPNESYFFAVKAVTSFGSETRESVHSDIVEAAMAPRSIQFLVFPTVHDVTLVWHSPNQVGYEGQLLYEAEYYIRYRMSGEESWTHYDEGKPVTGDTVKLGNNENSFEYGKSYDFQALMRIKGEDGSETEIASDVISAVISEDYTPDAVSDYTIISDRSDYIGVQWIVPKWSLTEMIADDFCYFIIERAEGSSEEWTVILDEEADGQRKETELISEDDVGETLAYQYKDRSAVPGVSYRYRVTTVLKPIEGDDESVYRSGTPIASEEGHLFCPDVVSASAAYQSMGPAKAGVTLSFAPYELADDLGLKWGVRRTVMHPEGDAEVSVIPEAAHVDGSFGFIETLSKDDPDLYEEHQYSYELVLLREDGNIYREYQEFASESPLSLAVKPLITEDISTRNNRVGRIEISWGVFTGDEYVSPESYTYSYSIDGGERYPIGALDIGNGRFSALIDMKETGKVDLRLYASALDDQYFSVSTSEASVLSFPDDFSLSISSFPDRVDLSWNSTNAILDGIEYEYQYSEDGDSWSEPFDVDISSNGISIGKDSIEGNDILVRFRAYNASHENEGSVYSDIVKGGFLSAPENIRATKGEYKDRVVITWDGVEGAESYSVYRYSLPDLSDAERIASGITDTEYPDQSPDLSKPYYTVASAMGTGETEKPSDFGSEQNEVTLEMEQVNLGYALGSVTSASAGTAPKDGSGHYMPYTVLTWTRAPGASEYTISVLGESVIVPVSGNDHSAAFTDGDLSYQPTGLLEGTYTYHDDTGILRDSLDITGYTIAASNGSGLSSEAVPVDGSARRQLKAEEYVNLLNGVLSFNLANVGFSDWWTGSWDVASGGDSSQNEYAPGNGFEVHSAHGGTSPGSNPGWIGLRDYSQYGSLLFNTRTGGDWVDIRIWADDGGSGGYLGVDPLKYIGYMDNDSNAEARQGFVDITGDGYWPAVVQLYNIDVTTISSNAYYNVTINDGEPVRVPDSASLVRPY